MNDTQKLVFSMLMEKTGIHMMDSGGGEGRHWQRNAKRDITKDDEVWLDIPDRPCQSSDIEITVSLYHYLPTVLELDDICKEFNALPVDDWNSDIYGVSEAGAKWLTAHGFRIEDSWNTYNGESNLSQTLQGTEVARGGLGRGDYVLLQVHGGADVRGGYTDAKMFKYQKFQEMIDPCPRVWATLIPADGDEAKAIDLDMRESGYGLVASDTSEPITVEEGAIIKCGL